MFNMFSLALLVFLLTCMQICSAVVCGNRVEKKFSKIEIDIVLIEIPRAKVLIRHVEKCDLIAKQMVHSVLNLAVFVRKLPSYFCCCCCCCLQL